MGGRKRDNKGCIYAMSFLWRWMWRNDCDTTVALLSAKLNMHAGLIYTTATQSRGAIHQPDSPSILRQGTELFREEEVLRMHLNMNLIKRQSKFYTRQREAYLVIWLNNSKRRKKSWEHGNTGYQEAWKIQEKINVENISAIGYLFNTEGTLSRQFWRVS